jgi:hypothetical protein
MRRPVQARRAFESKLGMGLLPEGGGTVESLPDDIEIMLSGTRSILIAGDSKQHHERDEFGTASSRNRVPE